MPCSMVWGGVKLGLPAAPVPTGTRFAPRELRISSAKLISERTRYG